ncbi:MAG: DUF1801 domain-containing protein [Myxococcota bacterium]|nr:DUF1801 domain-containing protein [Myxococcota bacterium]
MKKIESPESPEVAAVFEGYPPQLRRKLLALRALIFETAAATEGVGPIEETLKWGEPAYLTSESKSGSTIRIHWKESAPREYAMCFHCQTTLVSDFRRQFPDVFRFDGNRRIVFEAGDRLPKGPLASCIAAALTYHLDKAPRRRSRARVAS